MKPKSIHLITRFSLSALAIGILTACGGGGSDNLDVADGGIRGTGSSVGPVSGFGSVFVNGVRFDTGSLNGQVQSDDGITTESELDEGMILRVDGEWRDDGQGTANRVEYDDTLRGEVVITQPWDPATKTARLSMYGLVVHIDNQTVVKGKQVIELISGDFVRVSAWRLPNGEFRASFVGALSDSASGTFDQENEIELEGQVSNFDADLCRFEIGDITVACDRDDTGFDGIGISELAGSPFVEVEGSFEGDVLFASEIAEDDLRRYRGGDDDDIEFAGPVSLAINPQTRLFEINGLFVRVTDDTEFDDGLTDEDLTPDLLIQVEGEFLDDGTVEAEEITLREGESEVEGRIGVNSVNVNDQSFRIGGVLVQVTPLTAMVREDENNIRLEDLGGPEQVEVSGVERVNTDGGVYLEAFKVEIDDDQADGEFELVGRLRSIQGTAFNVLGVSIETNTGTEFDDTTFDALLSLVDDGERPLIEVEYDQLNNGNLVATEIELEKDDDD
ncbi:hypothetical protein FDP08_08295 [Marinobacter panjinensis]|uniref:DUF5666 domain-containing protein n=1 Tax=Marinobacter panjinensis TaxID=2576384 RepID=A0A4U6R3A1_9GAMM|nr:DUF5666 domain-containing protein [Marinobacter panjinensis]MCR8913226.1 DUF5666 domain-containing protein [Marinobacter panjinensis]TKV68090.1 hypothetical protein FDP08_08295 [Marinobacter panjinensis]